MNDIGKIYKITNLINGKIYVGQTWYSLSNRFWRHKNRTEGCVKLEQAFNKYGRGNFSIELITTCSSQIELDSLETYFIAYYDSTRLGYNCRSGGLGGKHSVETKKKISRAMKGRVFSEESKRKMSQARIGIKLSEETKQRIKDNNKAGTSEVRQKRSESMTKKATPEIIDTVMNLHKLGTPQTEIGKVCGLTQSYVSRIVNGSRRNIRPKGDRCDNS